MAGWGGRGRARLLTSVRWRRSWPPPEALRWAPLVDVADEPASGAVPGPAPLLPSIGPSACENSCAIMEADSLMVVDSKRSANSSPLSFQLSFWQIKMLRGVRFLWMSLQMACKKLSASRIWPSIRADRRRVCWWLVGGTISARQSGEPEGAQREQAKGQASPGRAGRNKTHR